MNSTRPCEVEIFDFIALRSRNRRSAASLVREFRPARKQHADKAVRASVKSAQIIALTILAFGGLRAELKVKN